MLACFVALGFTAPGGIATPTPDRWFVRPRNGLIVVAAMVVLFVITPQLARILTRLRFRRI